jgi:glycerate 2-kinase
LEAADPANAVTRNLRREDKTLQVGPKRYDLAKGRVFLVGVGKASVAMGSAAERVLGDKLSQGILVAKGSSRDSDATTTLSGSSRLSVHFAGHPISDQRSVDAADAIEVLLGSTTVDDLVLFLVSGGASALLSQPMIPLRQWQKLNELLLKSGCTIDELNTVRRRLDRVKGGGLSRLASPASQVSLILSDVVGNRLEAIGSGPTVANPDTVQDARDVLSQYGIAESLGSKEWGRIEELLGAAEVEGAPVVEPALNLIIGDVRQAAEAAAVAAREIGFSTQVLTTRLAGEAREVGKVVGALAVDAPLNSCLILGGETTVTVRGDGIGGRNLELALSAALSIAGKTCRVVATFATDGEDGLSGAAGATVTGETIQIAQAIGLSARDYLDRNDSYHFFHEAGGLLETGQTGTNVNDLVFAINYES